MPYYNQRTFSLILRILREKTRLSSSRYIHWCIGLYSMLLLLVFLIPFYIAYLLLNTIKIGKWSYCWVLMKLSCWNSSARFSSRSIFDLDRLAFLFVHVLEIGESVSNFQSARILQYWTVYQSSRDYWCYSHGYSQWIWWYEIHYINKQTKHSHFCSSCQLSIYIHDLLYQGKESRNLGNDLNCRIILAYHR